MRNRLLLSLCAALAAAGIAPAAPRPLQEAEAAFLEAYDLREDASPLEVPEVAPRDRPAMRWLAAAAAKGLPANPFRKGSRAWREAESLRRLSNLPPASWPRAIESQPLTLSGSRLAFWRWGQPRARKGLLNPELRQRWEDKLLQEGTPDLLQDFALRHALCFALAEGDEARFAQLKERWSESVPVLFLNFQRAFALLGCPSPLFSLWKLPEITALDISLQALGAQKIWMAQDPGQGLPELPADTVWIVPTKEGKQPQEQFELLEPSLGEARSLAARLRKAGRSAFLAPTRKSFETYALVYFPIHLDLDSAGVIRKIRMADAALAQEP